MSAFIRKHGSTLIVLMMVGLVVGANVPAVAHGGHAQSAHNSDKVDGFHAVAASATNAQRKGKLVATNPSTGKLPNSIIAKALDSGKLDGFDSLDFALASHSHAAADVTSGELPDARVADDITVGAAGITGDGTGSGLDADLLDGKSAADFVAQAGTGIVLVQGDVSAWRLASGSGPVSVASGWAQTTVQATTAKGSANMFIVPDLPLAAYGKELRMAGVELCYDASTEHVVDQIVYLRTANTSGSPATNEQSLDSTDRDDEACRFYTLTDPGLFSTSTVGLRVATSWSATNGTLRLGRVTFMLEPTATDATPLS